MAPYRAARAPAAQESPLPPRHHGNQRQVVGLRHQHKIVNAQRTSVRNSVRFHARVARQCFRCSAFQLPSGPRVTTRFHYAPAAKTDGAGDWRAVVNVMPRSVTTSWPPWYAAGIPGRRAPDRRGVMAAATAMAIPAGRTVI